MEESIDCLSCLEPGLLETDIRSGSFNSSPNWNASGDRWKSPKLILSDLNPFQELRITDTTALNRIDGRNVCDVCKKSRKYYCYTCCVPLSVSRDFIPKISKLPVKIDVIKHRKEIDGKSTATHAKVICPNDVRIFIYPEIPDFDLETENVVLLFPSKHSSRSLKEYVSESGRRIDRVIFIDSTWNQTKTIYSNPKIRSLPTIQITERETIFWRYQTGKPKNYLSTIEAIYYFLVDHHLEILQSPYEGQYDDILFLYKFMFEKIHELYDRSKLRRYCNEPKKSE